MADSAGDSGSGGAVSKAKNFFGTKKGKICLIVGGALLVIILIIISVLVYNKYIKKGVKVALVQASRGHSEKSKINENSVRNSAGGAGESRLAGSGDEDDLRGMPTGGMGSGSGQPQGRDKKKGASSKGKGADGKAKKGGKGTKQAKTKSSLEGMAGSFLDGLNEIKLNAIALKDQLSPSGSKSLSSSSSSSKK